MTVPNVLLGCIDVVFTPFENCAYLNTSVVFIHEYDKSTAERDLGIIITTNLKSTIQANKAASKANSILGLMKRTFVSRNVPL